MAMNYVSGFLGRMGRDFRYLRNAPHFYRIPWNRLPRVAGYITAAAVTVPVASVSGWVLNRAATVAAYPFHVVSDAVYNNPYAPAFAVAPFRPLEDPLGFGIAAAGTAGVVAGAAVGARAGLAAGRRAADLWTRTRETRNAVARRVRRYYQDSGVPGVVPAGAVESPLDTQTREYMERFWL